MIIKYEKEVVSDKLESLGEKVSTEVFQQKDATHKIICRCAEGLPCKKEAL